MGLQKLIKISLTKTLKLKLIKKLKIPNTDQNQTYCILYLLCKYKTKILITNKIKERLKNFRQAGLDKDGEYSLENLAFKDLRNTGYLEKLSNLKNSFIDKTLSLVESVDKDSLFEKFMAYACNELQIQNPPTFEVRYEYGEDQPSFGAYIPSKHHISVNPSNRNIVDVLRTLAHELVHARQNEMGILQPDSGETGSEHENDANAIAGILMRDYGKQNPNIYNIGMLNEVKEERPKVTRIYLDMDGVIAGFDDQFKKYNKEGYDFKEFIREYGANKAWDIINKGKEDFWAGMGWNPGGKQLYDSVVKLADEKGFEVWILSSPGLDPNGDAKRGKNKWLDKIITDISNEKSADWYNEVWSSIIANDGSVQHLDWMSEHDKEVFKTGMEIDQRWIVDHAAHRQEFIDQAQSINLFFRPDVNIKYLHAVHYQAWKQGLKTLYYCRSEKLAKADKVSKRIERQVIQELDLKALASTEEVCLACEG